MRQGDYKYVFAEQRSPGTMQVWAEPFTKLRLQKIYNLFQDPFERADITSNTSGTGSSTTSADLRGDGRGRSSSRRHSRNSRRARFPPSFVAGDDHGRNARKHEERAKARHGGKAEGVIRVGGSPELFRLAVIDMPRA